MKSRNDKILDWAIQKVKSEYHDDVALLVVYGSYESGTDGTLSDVDFYFIPKNIRANELAKTFIIEGIGYDLFPMRWERIEGLATLSESLIPLLGEATIVYCNSDEDRNHFQNLQSILHRNLSDSSFMHQKAIDKLSQAVETEDNLAVQSNLCNCRLSAGDILLQLADSVAYENMTYFKKGLKTQFDDLKTMDKLPRDFIEIYESIIQANNIIHIQERCENLIRSCGSFLNVDIKSPTKPRVTISPIQKSRDVDFDWLAEWYGEIISTFNKIYSCCENHNNVLAFISAVTLQHEFNDCVRSLYFDILSDFDMVDLSRLSASVKTIETELVKYITSGANIRRYASVDEFLLSN